MSSSYDLSPATQQMAYAPPSDGVNLFKTVRSPIKMTRSIDKSNPPLTNQNVFVNRDAAIVRTEVETADRHADDEVPLVSDQDVFVNRDAAIVRTEVETADRHAGDEVPLVSDQDVFVNRGSSIAMRSEASHSRSHAAEAKRMADDFLRKDEARGRAEGHQAKERDLAERSLQTAVEQEREMAQDRARKDFEERARAKRLADDFLRKEEARVRAENQAKERDLAELALKRAAEQEEKMAQERAREKKKMAQDRANVEERGVLAIAKERADDAVEKARLEESKKRQEQERMLAEQAENARLEESRRRQEHERKLAEQTAWQEVGATLTRTYICRLHRCFCVTTVC